MWFFFSLLLLLSGPLAAEVPAIRIGVLTDMSGGMAGAAGLGAVEAAQMAVEDFWKKQGTEKKARQQIIVMNADYQNRADLAQHISKSWLSEQGVDVVVDVPNPAIARKLQNLFAEHDRVLLSSSRGAAMKEESCTPHRLSWLYDQRTLARNLIAALLAEDKKRWFIIGNDDMHGMQSVRDAKESIKKGGGTLAGEALFGKRMAGLEMVLEQIKKENVDVILLAFDRPDILHLLRNWPKEKLAGLPPLALSPLFITDVHELQEEGLPAFFTIAPFYWAQDEASRNWAKAFARRCRGAMPTEVQASIFAQVSHYLAGRNTGASTPSALLAQRRTSPPENALFGASQMRKDGLILQRLHLLAYKLPETREDPWDYFKIARSMPPAELHLPDEVKCNNGDGAQAP